MVLQAEIAKLVGVDLGGGGGVVEVCISAGGDGGGGEDGEDGQDGGAGGAGSDVVEGKDADGGL